jgi:hypothetical protein
MNNKGTVNNKGLFPALLVALFTFIYLFKVDANPFVLSDFCLPPNQTEIELLLSEHQDSNTEFRFFGYSSKQLTNFIPGGINSFAINRNALYHFNLYVNHQFKSLNSSFVPTNSFISVYHKTIPGRQTSDNDPFLLS